MQPFLGKNTPEIRVADVETVRQEQACSVLGESRVIASSEERA